MQELVKTACPQCGQQYRVEARQLGQTARCKKCGGAFPLGGAQQAAQVARPSSPPEAPHSGDGRGTVPLGSRARKLIDRARGRWSALSLRSKAAIGAVGAIVLLLLIVRPFSSGTTTAGDYTSAEVREIINILRDDSDTKHGLILEQDPRAISADLWKAVLGEPEGVASLSYDSEVWTYRTKDGAVTATVTLDTDREGNFIGPIPALYANRVNLSVSLSGKAVNREPLKARIMAIKARVDRSLPFADKTTDEIRQIVRQQREEERRREEQQRAEMMKRHAAEVEANLREAQVEKQNEREQAEREFAQADARREVERRERQIHDQSRRKADADFYDHLREYFDRDSPEREKLLEQADDWIARRAEVVATARRAGEDWQNLPLPNRQTVGAALASGRPVPVIAEGASDQEIGRDEPLDGFVSLFDGETLAGWTPTNGDGQPVSGWAIRDGAIVCESSEVGWLQSPEKYGDFDLRMEFRADRGDSGVLIRIGRANVQVEVCEDRSRREAEKRAGAVWGVAGPAKSLLKPLGEWNALRILCQARQVTVWVNGTQSADVNLDEHPQFGKVPDSGPFGLFNYHGAARGCEYRNIRIRSLPADIAQGE